MLGTLIYITLDVSFNVISWTSKKTIEGIGLIYDYVTYQPDYNKAILPPSYENTIKIIENEKDLEREQEGITALLEQIKIQKKLLNNLEASIINYKMGV